MILKDGTVVHRLKDRYATGYAGFGYGGDKLFVACLVDCFAPPQYLVRSDSFESALEVAIECLSSSFDEWASEEEKTEMAAVALLGPDAMEGFMAENTLTYSPSGRIVSADDDIQLRRIH